MNRPLGAPVALLLAELAETADGEVDADSAYRRAEAEAMLARKQVTSRIHQRRYRNGPLTDEQKESTLRADCVVEVAATDRRLKNED